MNTHRKNSTIIGKSAPLTAFKFAVDEAGKVAGYGSVFGNVDSYGERVMPGAFAKSLARHKAEGTRPLMLWQHNASEVIGSWLDLVEDDVGLKLSGRFNLDTTKGRDVHALVKAGDVGGLSIGYLEVVARPNGPVRELFEVDLKETSVVSFPANRQARVSGVKFESAADVERLLREGGAPRGAAAKIAAGGWPALTGETQSDPETLQLMRRLDSATAELRSIKG